MSSQPFLSWRQPGYDLLSGRGIEIGAFEHPARLPASCRVAYCDAITPEEAQKLFPEISTASFKKIDHLVNLNTGRLHPFRNASLDFVIFNHVIEHLVNPIRALKEVLRVLRPGGMLVVGAPDRDYTFDRHRPLTAFAHLYNDYVNNVTSASPEEYLDIARYIFPEYMTLPLDDLRAHLLNWQSRREHLHVWTSVSFRDFLDSSFDLFGERPQLVYEAGGTQTAFEYFGVWRRGHPHGVRGVFSRLRHRSRP